MEAKKASALGFLTKLASGEGDSKNTAASELGALLKKEGAKGLDSFSVVPALIAIDNEGCALGVKACLDNLGAAGVPHLVAVLPKLLELAGHKKAPTRTASEAAARDLIGALPGDALRVIKGALFGALVAKARRH